MEGHVASSRATWQLRSRSAAPRAHLMAQETVFLAEHMRSPVKSLSVGNRHQGGGMAAPSLYPLSLCEKASPLPGGVRDASPWQKRQGRKGISYVRQTSHGTPLRVLSMVESSATSATTQVADDVVVVSFPSTPMLMSYPDTRDSPVVISQHDSAADLSNALAQYIADASAEAVRERGAFVIALSGGSLLESLSPLASEPYLSKVDWSKWHVLWVDERFVRHETPDSNFNQAAAALLSKLPIPEENILPTDDEVSDAAEMAADYEALLRELVEDEVLSTTTGSEFPRFDLILLGIGPEGHTASLFPNRPAVFDTTNWVVPVTGSPKPPPQRITFTLPTINSARKVAFVAAGQGKAEVVQRVLERTALPGSLPAQLVRPYKGSVTWFLDTASASKLSPATWNNPKDYPFMKF